MYNGALADVGLGSDPFTSNRYAFGAGNPISGIEFDGHILLDSPGGGGDAPAPEPKVTYDSNYDGSPTSAVERHTAGGTDGAPTGCQSFGVYLCPDGAEPPETNNGSPRDWVPGVVRSFASTWDFLTPGQSGDAFADNVDEAFGADRGSGAYAFGEFVVGEGAQGLVGVGVGKNLGRIATAARTAAKACSFSGATLVLMADGSKKPIEKIEPGDKVIATDPETGEQIAKAVLNVWVHLDTLTDLVLADGTILTTTEDHPYWSVDDSKWERADELGDGEKVLAADGQVVEALGMRWVATHHGLAYNLNVEGIHTFHVGDNEILVHNSQTCPVPISKGAWSHIWERHVNRSRSNTMWDHKSKFYTTNKGKIQRMINQALGGDTADGAYYRKYSTPVGVSPEGEEQFYVRVFVRGGQVKSAFPSDGPN